MRPTYGIPSGEQGRSPHHTGPSSASGPNAGRYARTASRIASTRGEVGRTTGPESSSVPTNRTPSAIGVTATRASVRIEGTLGRCGGRVAVIP